MASTPHATIGGWLSGKLPSPDTAEHFLAALDATADERAAAYAALLGTTREQLPERVGLPAVGGEG